jgi:uncharacterized protein (TIGR00645 family)
MSDQNKNSGEKEGFSIENAIEAFIFSSRWILAIFYIGLVLGLFGLAIKFVLHFYHFGSELIHMNETETLLGVLALVDTTLLANLMLIVIFSGYENFVSVIGVAQDSPDRPKWMGDIDFAGLKLKLIGSIVALSGINLLAAFLDMQVLETELHKHLSNQQLAWMVGIHVTFMITGVLFALTEKIAEKKENSQHKSD